MNVALITIGNELLKGATVNTNAAWIGQMLFSVGATVRYQITVNDEPEAISSSLDYISSLKPKFVLITGGLGPTIDDVTRMTLYDYFGANEQFDEKYWQQLTNYFYTKTGTTISENNRSQAMIPDNGKVLPNPVGSARGSQFFKDGITYISMPGVPREMKLMVTEHVLPLIQKENPNALHQLRIRTTGLPESIIAEKVSDIVNEFHTCDFGFFPSPYGVDIVSSCQDYKTIETIESQITRLLSSRIYSKNNQNLESIVVKLLTQNHKTLSTAESCTGGLIGHRVTQVSGSSDVYEGGIISYSNAVKENQLSVQNNTLIQYGAVSKETAKEMAKGVRTQLRSSIGLSITGIAGPTGGTDEKPVGLVYIGYSDEDKTIAKKYNFGSDRSINKIRSSQAALFLLYCQLIEMIR